MAKTKTPHEYVVGYEGEHQVVYGKDNDGGEWVDKMTLYQAKTRVKQLDPFPRVIYKLVPVEFYYE